MLFGQLQESLRASVAEHEKTTSTGLYEQDVLMTLFYQRKAFQLNLQLYILVLLMGRVCPTPNMISGTFPTPPSPNAKCLAYF